MQLTLEQIKSITTGAVDIEPEENGIRFYRFNREQRTLHQPRVRFLAEKMLSTAGIQLFFRTDSSILFLRATVSKGSASNHFSFDLFVNGVLDGSAMIQWIAVAVLCTFITILYIGSRRQAKRRAL